MGVGTLNNRSAGQTILDTFFNDIHGALDGDLVGRDVNGVPTSGQNLGTAAFPWGTIRANSLVLNGSAVDTSKIVSPVNRIVSGKMRSTSNQPAFITPNGAAASFILKGASVSLVLDINGTAVSFSTDITKGSLTLAPSSNNTALVNDTSASGQADTRLWGEPEHFKTIIVDTMGSAISALVGTFQSFKIGTEYFYAFVKSTTELTRCRRGFFYDPSLNPLNRSTFSDDAVITLMKTGYIFADQDMATIDVSYNPPVYDFTAPNSPATGDYWYDLANKMWKRYDGATFAIINRTFVGWSVQDSTNCVAARCEHFYGAFSSANSLNIIVSTTEIAIAEKEDAQVNVYGNVINFGKSLPAWNITTNLAPSSDMYNATEQASTLYYLYLADNGKKVISDISPFYRDDLLAPYHPHNPWRCVGLVFNDGSSNIVQGGAISGAQTHIDISAGNGYGAVNTFIRRYSHSAIVGCGIYYVDDSNLGSTLTVAVPGFYQIHTGDNMNPGNIGASKNADGTAGLSSVAYSNILLMHLTILNDLITGASEPLYLKIGDVVRSHHDPATASVSTDQQSNFKIGKCG